MEKKFKAYIRTGSGGVRASYYNLDDGFKLKDDKVVARDLQWSGITDKRGVPIYEGDKVDVDGAEFVVEFKECAFRVGLVVLSGDCVVVGNIYE